ncbi:MAG TPA: PP2C family protein-serine/threonine phosphatase [Ilumatobacteraceae bacterium]|nr:PP2C family protein-serine/threonine phosphatase [Ilumatobacteraceae bacterium]
MLFNQAEDRLLQQRTNEASAVLQGGVTGVRAPLDAAAKIADRTDGDAAMFTNILGPVVGKETGKSYTSAALFRVGDTTPVAVLGDPIALPGSADGAVQAMLDAAISKPAPPATQQFVVLDLLAAGPRKLGYAVPSGNTDATYVVYAERTLSPDPNVRTRTDQPFAQLDYAIYIGDQPTTDRLISASVRDLPLEGRTAEKTTAFGNNSLLLVMTPIGNLSGDLFANLWWIVALGGALVAAGFAILTRRLLERRDTAMALASDNERLYDEQRHIAETLQLGLLPQHFDAPDGVTVAARYWPAGAANLIGGDFYDMFLASEDRWGFAIGDVCGKGIEAAALTGLARHTLRAAARNSSSPTDVLHAVHHALHEHQPVTFCTACFGFLSPREGGGYRIELSLGGHPQPLLRHSDGSVEPVGTMGMLLGMLEPTLSTTVVDVMPGDTLVSYTDGLTDAPADKAVSVEELAELLETDGDQPIEQLADSIRVLKRGRRPLGSDDDTALLILRFDVVPALPTTAASPFADEHATTAAGQPASR